MERKHRPAIPESPLFAVNPYLMKSKLCFLLLAFIAITAFKNNKGTAEEFRIKKTVSILRPQDSITYSYTSDGRIATYKSWWAEMWQSFEYAGNKVIEHGEGAIKGHPYTNTYYLGRNGWAD